MNHLFLNFRLLAIAAILTTLFACEKEEPTPPAPDAAVEIKGQVATSDAITFTVTSENAEQVAWICTEKSAGAVAADKVLAEGTKIEANTEVSVTVDSLTPNTSYIICVAAANADKKISMSSVEVMTAEMNVEVVAMLPSSASCTTSTGNFYITFYDENQNITLNADFYTADTDSYLPAGEYLLGSGMPGELSSRYTSYTIGDSYTPTYFTGGSVEVSLTTNPETYEITYTFSGTLIESETKQLKFAYTGKVEGIEMPGKPFDFVVDPSTQAPERIEVNGEVAGEYYLKFTNADWSELALDFMVDPATCNDGKAALPAGTYTIANGGLTTSTNISLYSPYFGGNFTEASAEVTVVGDVYTIVFSGVAEDPNDGSTMNLKMNYTGKIAGMVRENTPETTSYDINATSASCMLASGGIYNYYITFTDDATKWTFVADIYANEAYLHSGTYTLGTGNAGQMASRYTYVADANQNKYSLSDGVLEVVATPDVEAGTVHYQVTGNFTLTDGSVGTLTYSGEIEGITYVEDSGFAGFDFVVDPTTQAPARVSVNGEVPGEYYIKFTDADWSELALDFMADPALCDNGNAALPAGTYSIANGGLTTASNVSLYGSIYFGGNFVEATATVTVEGDIYTIAFEGVAEDPNDGTQQPVKMDYTGDIKSMKRTN